MIIAVTLALFKGTPIFPSRHLARHVSSGPPLLRDPEARGKEVHSVHGLDDGADVPSPKVSAGSYEKGDQARFRIKCRRHGYNPAGVQGKVKWSRAHSKGCSSSISGKQYLHKLEE